MLLSALPFLTFVCFWRRSPFVGAITGRPRVSGVTDISPRPQKTGDRWSPVQAYFSVTYISFDAKMSLIAAMSRRYHRTVIHSARDRLPFHHRKRVSPGNATTNKRHPRTKREVRGAPNPMSKNTGAPVGAPVFFGAANGIRTHDLVITNDVLYRLSYSSVSNA